MESKSESKEKEGIQIKTRRNKYEVKFKLEVIGMVKNGTSLHYIEDKYKIDRSTIRNWKKNEDELLQVKYNKNKFRKKRNNGIIKNILYTQEENICNFIIDCREKNKAIGTKSIVCYAGKINAKIAENKIKTKLMWCYRFLKRHGFSIRRVSHIGQTIPENMNNLIDTLIYTYRYNNFLFFLKIKLIPKYFNKNQTFN